MEAWMAAELRHRPYRVLAPAAPGAAAYWMAMALLADASGRADLVQPALDAAYDATMEAIARRESGR